MTPRRPGAPSQVFSLSRHGGESFTMRRGGVSGASILSVTTHVPALWRLGTSSPLSLPCSRWLSALAHKALQHPGDKKFVDRVVVQARGGSGGHGCVSFRKGRTGKIAADGGNGGDGGDVVVRASRNVKSLAGLPQLLVSKSGGHGSSKNKHGRKGSDGIYLVPLGTQVRRFLERRRVQAIPAEGYREGDDMQLRLKKRVEIDSLGPMMIDLALEQTAGEEFDEKAEGGAQGGVKRVTFELIGDLVQDGDSLIVAKGGTGGRGNVGVGRYGHDHRSDHELGEFVRLELEMKMISDLSLVGFPNVGKSSLLRQLSSAVPKVGSYAFTTTTPQLGSVSVKGSPDRRFVVADVPGLIEGAHLDRGVGHTFLKHVERANAIAYVLDASGAYALDGCKTPLTPEEQLMRLQTELGQFSQELLDKRWMIVLNKMDLMKRRKAFVEKFRVWVADRYGEVTVVGVSALAPDTRSIDSISTLAHAMKDVIS